MSNNTSTSVGIHPHDTPMTVDLHPMPELQTTVLKIYFGKTMNGVNIFLTMTAQEVIALLEEIGRLPI